MLLKMWKLNRKQRGLPMYKLRKVISGGQTGADRTGLECAKALGLETGGHAPKFWRTDEGPDPSLRDLGLVETLSYNYAARTALNVRNADITLWFGKTGSPGFWCTLKACGAHGKELIVNPNAETLRMVCEKHEVINIAGNRKRINPEVVGLVQEAFREIEKLIKPEQRVGEEPV